MTAIKKFIIGKAMSLIKSHNFFDETKLRKIEYGLTSIYLTFSKIIIILLISISIKKVNEVIIFMITYNILRTFSFGLHATKSWICLLSSTMIFIGIPILCDLIYIPINIKIGICILGIIFIFKNSPADTYKRPIVSKKRRKFYKFISTILVIVYSFIIVFINNNFYSNCLLFAVVVQNLLISPTTYRVFNLPYDNYINFLNKHPDFVKD